MAVVGTVVMAIQIAIAVISARLVQALVHGKSLSKLENIQTLKIALWVTSVINV